MIRRLKVLDKTIQLQLTVILGLLLVFFIDWILLNSILSDSIFANFLDPFLSIATALLALYIWWNNRNDNLPKRLTVHFVHATDKGTLQYVYTCHEAYLSGVSDIRTWGQQIGRQMNGNHNLEFYPYIDQTSKEVTKESVVKSGMVSKSGKKIVLYEVRFFLQKIPDAANGYVVSYDNNSQYTPKNVEIRLGNNNYPNTPFSIQDAIDYKFKKKINA